MREASGSMNNGDESRRMALFATGAPKAHQKKEGKDRPMSTAHANELSSVAFQLAAKLESYETDLEALAEEPSSRPDANS
jgi:hypothetical protein